MDSSAACMSVSCPSKWTAAEKKIMRIDKRRSLTVVIVIWLGSVAGCSSPAACSECFANFQRSMEGAVGAPMDLQSSGLAGNLLSETALPNGNIEYRFRHYRSGCELIYEVNPNTRIIERDGFLGDVQNCIAPLK
jgi:hypothetical protein